MAVGHRNTIKWYKRTRRLTNVSWICSQGCVATHARCGRIFSDNYITNLLTNVNEKEFSKSAFDQGTCNSEMATFSSQGGSWPYFWITLYIKLYWLYYLLPLPPPLPPPLPFNSHFTRWTWVRWFLQVLLFKCSGREPLGMSGTGFLMARISFLPPNWQCQSTKGNTRH